jgi:hypothetical protein
MDQVELGFGSNQTNILLFILLFCMYVEEAKVQKFEIPQLIKCSQSRQHLVFMLGLLLKKVSRPPDERGVWLNNIFW